MALTLIEAAKLNPADLLRNAVIRTYAEAHDLLRVLPFETIPGNALRYNQEAALPGVGFRGVNEAFAESTGVINPVTEVLTIGGGDIEVDRFIVQTMGEAQRVLQEAMKIKSLAHTWAYTFINGDSTQNAAQFDGLQVRLDGDQKVAAGSSAGGDALSLAKLDELIDSVDEPTHLYMNKAMRRRLTQAARNGDVGGQVYYGQDDFGRRIAFYDDLPILIADANSYANPALAFSEACPGGGATAGTSIYCLSLRDNRLVGIQSAPPEVRDLGESDQKPVLRTRVEWYSGIALFHPRAAARLWGIKDAAIVS